ncbi:MULTISPECIES: hypothetical protein [Nocardioides]|uniref:hypothetical protein n=1 Tax=Nocardioides TaxID=1839 RepID=UPI001A8E2B4E|nr:MULTISPECIES: hypothetical protein [Nocardioides]
MNQLPDAVVASRPTATVGCYTVPDSDPALARSASRSCTGTLREPILLRSRSL